MSDETNRLLVEILASMDRQAHALTMLAEQVRELTRQINARVDDHERRISRLEGDRRG